MAQEIRVPALGESVTEAVVAQWYKKVGDTVAIDETLLELETDKVTLEVPAPSAGVIEAIAAEEGATVEAGALLGSINADGAAAAVTAPAAQAEPKAPETGPEPTSETPAAVPAGGESAAASPAARKILSEKGVDAGAVNGSGKAGRITKADAMAVVEGATAPLSTPTPAPAPAPAPVTARAPSAPDDESREERVRMTRLRQTVARRLKLQRIREFRDSTP